MATGLSKIRDTFLAEMGGRLATLGFPSKMEKGTYQFALPTNSGFVGVGFNPRHRGRQGIDFQVRCSIEISSVENALSRTEIYENSPGWKAKNSAHVWSCSGLLKEMCRYQGGLESIDPSPSSEETFKADVPKVTDMLALYGTDDGYLDAEAQPDKLSEVADRVYDRVKIFGWPFLERYGKSEEAFLELTLRKDRLAEYMFLDPRKYLAGLILAKKLENQSARKKLLSDALAIYRDAAKNGNSELLAQFKRVASQLGLVNSDDFSLRRFITWGR